MQEGRAVYLSLASGRLQSAQYPDVRPASPDWRNRNLFPYKRDHLPANARHPVIARSSIRVCKAKYRYQGIAPGGGRRYRASGFFHSEIFVEGYQTDRALGSIEPFANENELRTYLTEPTVAFFLRNKDTEVLHTSHKHVELSVVQITDFRFPYLTSSGLVDEAKLKASGARSSFAGPPSCCTRQKA